MLAFWEETAKRKSSLMDQLRVSFRYGPAGFLGIHLHKLGTWPREKREREKEREKERERERESFIMREINLTSLIGGVCVCTCKVKC